MLKSIAKKIVISIILAVIVLSGIAPNYSYAALTKEQSEGVANFARNFINEGNAKKVGVSHPGGFLDSVTGKIIPCEHVNGHALLQYNQGHRTKNGYQGSSPYEGHLWFDCSSFATFVYDYVLGLGLQASNNNWPYTTTSFANDTINFSELPSINVEFLQPGDLLWRKGHVAIYIGNGQIAEASMSTKGLIISNIGTSFTRAFRVKDIGDRVPNTTITWPDGDYSGDLNYGGDFDGRNR